MQKTIPTPRTDSGWSWADFWQWYRMQPQEIQAQTFQMNDLVTTISAMAPDVMNEVLYYAPVDVQAIFQYGVSGMQASMERMRKIMEQLR